jgi:hypothetical protein
MSCQLPVTSYKLQATSYKPQATSYKLLPSCPRGVDAKQTGWWENLKLGA